MGNDRYRQALEGLRERCAQEAERITARSRTLAAMINAEAVKPCEVAAAIRKIDVQQYYECVAKEIEQLRAEVERDKALLRQALEALEGWIFVGMPKDVETYCRCMDSTLTAADKLRERLGWGPANVPPLPR